MPRKKSTKSKPKVLEVAVAPPIPKKAKIGARNLQKAKYWHKKEAEAAQKSAVFSEKAQVDATHVGANLAHARVKKLRVVRRAKRAAKNANKPRKKPTVAQKEHRNKLARERRAAKKK